MYLNKNAELIVNYKATLFHTSLLFTDGFWNIMHIHNYRVVRQNKTGNLKKISKIFTELSIKISSYKFYSYTFLDMSNTH